MEEINLSLGPQPLAGGVERLQTAAGLLFVKHEGNSVAVLRENDWTTQELRAIADYLDRERNSAFAAS